MQQGTSIQEMMENVLRGQHGEENDFSKTASAAEVVSVPDEAEEVAILKHADALETLADALESDKRFGNMMKTAAARAVEGQEGAHSNEDAGATAVVEEELQKVASREELRESILSKLGGMDKTAAKASSVKPKRQFRGDGSGASYSGVAGKLLGSNSAAANFSKKQAKGLALKQMREYLSGGAISKFNKHDHLKTSLSSSSYRNAGGVKTASALDGVRAKFAHVYEQAMQDEGGE